MPNYNVTGHIGSDPLGGAGDTLKGAWEGTGLTQKKNYDPYAPDPSSFQNPYAEGNIGRYQQGVAGAQGRQAPYVDPYWQQGNRSLAEQLFAQANGQGPSIAQNQFQRSLDQALAAQTAAAGTGATANNPALAQRTLANQLAGMNQAAAGQAGMLRLNEQMQARGMLANVLGQGQQGDISRGGLDLQSQAQIDQMTQFYESLGYSQAEANRQAMIEMERIRAGAYSSAQGYQYGQNQGNQNTAGGLLGGIIGAGGQVAGMYAKSDERSKTDVREGGGAARSFLESLGAALLYRYKNPQEAGAAPGQQMGVMAQDVAKTPMGQQMVVPTNEGLMLDPARSLGAVLAGQADLHNRTKALESRDTKGRDIHSPAPLAEGMQGYDPSMPTMPLNSTVGPRQQMQPAAPPKKRGRSILDILMSQPAGQGGGSGVAGGDV